MQTSGGDESRQVAASPVSKNYQNAPSHHAGRWQGRPAAARSAEDKHAPSSLPVAPEGPAGGSRLGGLAMNAAEGGLEGPGGRRDAIRPAWPLVATYQRRPHCRFRWSASSFPPLLSRIKSCQRGSMRSNLRARVHQAWSWVRLGLTWVPAPSQMARRVAGGRAYLRSVVVSLLFM